MVLPCICGNPSGSAGLADGAFHARAEIWVRKHGYTLLVDDIVRAGRSWKIRYYGAFEDLALCENQLSERAPKKRKVS